MADSTRNIRESSDEIAALGDGSFSIGSSVWPGTSKVIEEMGEALQVFGKLLATAGHPAHWDGSDLGLRAVEEVGDVLGALAFWQAENLTPRQRIDISQRAEEKRRLFESWHHDQRRTARSPE